MLTRVGPASQPAATASRSRGNPTFGFPLPRGTPFLFPFPEGLPCGADRNQEVERLVGLLLPWFAALGWATRTLEVGNPQEREERKNQEAA